MLDVYMRQLSKETGSDPAIEPSLPGLYEYWIAPDLCVVIKALQPQGFSFSSTFGTFPKEKGEAFMEEMMAGNLFGKETFKASLGLDLTGENMVLAREIDYRCDYREFKETLEDFVHIIRFWRIQAGLSDL